MFSAEGRIGYAFFPSRQNRKKVPSDISLAPSPCNLPRVFWYWLIRKNAYPNLASALNIIGHGFSCRLQLLGIHPTCLFGFEPIRTEGQSNASGFFKLSSGRHSLPLSKFYSFW